MNDSEKLPRVRPFIGGAEADPAGGDYFEDLDPSTGQVLAYLARCGSADVDKAVEAAREATAGWRAAPVRDRAQILYRLGDIVRGRAEELARLEARDTGKPLSQANTDVEMAARYFQFYAGIADKVYGETIPIDQQSFGLVFREPLGVTAHIIPWNYPLQIAARTLAPALATGNCCVLKPAEEASLTSVKLGGLGLEAGLPAGVLNILPGFGEEAGSALASHPSVDHISFTGSVETGSLVMKMAADNVRPVTLELGGKSPNIVFADADLDRALPAILRSLIQNAGQTCSAGTRLLVESSVAEPVIAAVTDLMKGVRLGPSLEDPDMGPLISERQMNRVLGYLKTAEDEGARVLTGRGRATDDRLSTGYFVEPALLDSVTQEMRIANEEVFGPVLAVLPFSDVDEAIEIANASPYGLVAAVWTKDINKAMKLARELRCGQVFINSFGAGGGVELPFGGYKRSGFGREKGSEAIREFTQVKTVAIQLS